MGLHFLLFWPCGPSFLAVWLCGPSFPFILAFSGSASGPPPTSCQKWPVCPTSLQWIYQRRDRLHFAVFSILGLHFLYFGLVGLHFLAFWPCGPSFPCILAFSGSASGPPPTSCQNDGMRSVQGPGGFNVLFYDGMRSVQGPGGFNVLFYFCYDVSHSATEVKKPKKVFHYVMGSFGWVGCCQSNFNTWWGAILQTPMNPKLREARGRRQAGPTAAVSLTCGRVEGEKKGLAQLLGTTCPRVAPHHHLLLRYAATLTPFRCVGGAIHA